MTGLRGKSVILPDRDELGQETDMRFRLVYDGPLAATQGDPRNGQPVARATEKQEIRKAFHAQLRELWRTNKFLSSYTVKDGEIPAVRVENSVGRFGFGYHDSNKPAPQPLVDYLADQHPCFGYKFVPLAREAFTLSCGLEILFLRRDPPGSVYTAGDIDNRIKTLIDGLRMPKSVAELGKYTAPDADESPFYCLLEDDKAITALSVESDTLLSRAVINNPSWAHVIVTVDIRPYVVTTFNLALA